MREIRHDQDTRLPEPMSPLDVETAWNWERSRMSLDPKPLAVGSVFSAAIEAAQPPALLDGAPVDRAPVELKRQALRGRPAPKPGRRTP